MSSLYVLLLPTEDSQEGFKMSNKKIQMFKVEEHDIPKVDPPNCKNQGKKTVKDGQSIGINPRKREIEALRVRKPTNNGRQDK